MAIAAAAADRFSGYNQDDEYADLENADVSPSLLSLFTPNIRQSVLEDSDLHTEETKDIGASFSVSKGKPLYGVSAGVSLLKPQIEVLHLIEAFLKLKAELVTHLYAIINENYDLIKAVLNLVFSKVTNLQAFTLKGISVLRKIIEFSLYLFGGWNVGISPPIPHEVYGVPIYK